MINGKPRTLTVNRNTAQMFRRSESSTFIRIICLFVKQGTLFRWEDHLKNTRNIFFAKTLDKSSLMH